MHTGEIDYQETELGQQMRMQLCNNMNLKAGKDDIILPWFFRIQDLVEMPSKDIFLSVTNLTAEQRIEKVAPFQWNCYFKLYVVKIANKKKAL